MTKTIIGAVSALCLLLTLTPAADAQCVATDDAGGTECTTLFAGQTIDLYFETQGISTSSGDRAVWGNPTMTAPLDSDGDGLADSWENGSGTYVSRTDTGSNAGNPDSDGTSMPHEQFLIGEEATYVPNRSGYLRAFANDSILAYGNNRGSLKLTVSRLA